MGVGGGWVSGGRVDHLDSGRVDLDQRVRELGAPRAVPNTHSLLRLLHSQLKLNLKLKLRKWQSPQRVTAGFWEARPATLAVWRKKLEFAKHQPYHETLFRSGSVGKKNSCLPPRERFEFWFPDSVLFSKHENYAFTSRGVILLYLMLPASLSLSVLSFLRVMLNSIVKNTLLPFLEILEQLGHCSLISQVNL